MNPQQVKHWLRACYTQHDVLPSKPLIMGILNRTPDSFSDGGRFFSTIEKAFDHVMRMIQEGADLIDIGGESSKPGARPISLDEELSRVIPIIERIRRQSDICISIDTCKAEVMAEAISAGANMINDITALQDQSKLSVAARSNVPVCLMHMQGTPQTMQENPTYSHDIIDTINQFFMSRIQACVQAGIKRENIILDPGLCFGKTLRHNQLILKRIAEFERHRLPLLLGASRKSFIGTMLDEPERGRLVGSIAVAVYATLQTHHMIIRTHDVKETSQALYIVHTIKQT